MKFYRYYRNDPFFVSKAELDAATDREVYETFYQAYEKDDTQDRLAAMEQQQAAAEKAYMDKTLEERKSDYYAMCRNYNVPEKQIDASWKKYLETGSTE